jgi:hypothetical protein
MNTTNEPNLIPVIYSRRDPSTEDELKAASKYFPVYRSLLDIPKNSLVLNRYSVWPFYWDLCADILRLGSVPVSRPNQVASTEDAWKIYMQLGSRTPKVWRRLEDLPDDGTQFVLKFGRFSKRDLWKTHMFAANKAEAVQVWLRLKECAVGDEEIFIKEYKALDRLSDDNLGVPLSNEYRIFVFDDTIVDWNFYWESRKDEVDPVRIRKSLPVDFVQGCIDRFHGLLTFYAMDIALLEDQKTWTVIEVNEGQQSGLSGINPDVFYKRLHDSMLAF